MVSCLLHGDQEPPIYTNYTHVHKGLDLGYTNTSVRDRPMPYALL